MEKRVQKLLLVLIMGLFVISLVNAFEVQVKTVPYDEVQVAIAEPTGGAFQLIDRGTQYANQYGDAYFTFDIEKEKADIYIYVKDGTTNVASERILGEDITEEMYFEVAPANFEFIATPEGDEPVEELIVDTTNETEQTNETIQNETTLLQQSPESEPTSITGLALFGEGGFFSGKTLYWSIGIIVGIIVIIIVFIFMKNRKPSNNGEIKVRKLSEMKQEKQEKIEDNMQIIEDAERKIEEARAEINKLKSDEKIKAAQKKLREDEEELLRLRQGR